MEVLIAMVIVSLGLMSTAAMQSTAITGNSFAKEADVAIQLAEEMIDRIRVNAGDNADRYDGIDTSGACGGQEPALTDCIDWKTRLENQFLGLTGATGVVAVSSDDPITSTSMITVTVAWGSKTGDRNVTLMTIVENITS